MVVNTFILSFQVNGWYYYYSGNRTGRLGNDMGFRSRFRVKLKRKIDIKEP